MTADDLNTAIAFPFFPFRTGAMDLAGLRKNARYLVQHGALDRGRRRVIATGGSSLLHHLTAAEQVEAARVVGEEAGALAWFISGVVPTPLVQAERLIRDQMALPRPPDLFLLLPLLGSYNPEGARRELASFCDGLGHEGARFVLYLRDGALREAYCDVVEASGSVLGIKIGTGVEDVAVARRRLGEECAVVWGIGDVSTAGVRAGARGHTSGVAALCIRLCDELNNAHRRGDFDAADHFEGELRGLEEIRFMHARAYNYCGLREALVVAGFDDVEPGDGGPFNAPPPPDIVKRIRAAAERLRAWH